jgi:lysyl-tRNA synthetase, class II
MTNADRPEEGRPDDDRTAEVTGDSGSWSGSVTGRVVRPIGGVSDQMRVRLAKRDRLRAAGIDPYPVGFPRTATIAEVRERHPDLEPDAATGDRVGVTGRVMLSRVGGKLCFATIRDGTGEIQVMISLDRTGEQALAA